MTNNILSSFYEIAKQNPESIASTDSTGEITFGQLLENSLKFYQSITKLSIQNKRVAIFLPNGIEALSAVVSTLTAGFCYAILDPSSPSERNEVICNIGEFDFLLTNTELLIDAHAIHKNNKILIYNDLLKSEAFDFKLIPDVDPADSAILFFTSGSTGTPKGVVHTHGRIAVGLKSSTIEKSDHFDMIVPMGFVASMNMLFTINSGAKISFFDVKNNGIAAYCNFLKEKKITHCLITVSAFRAMANILVEADQLVSLKVLMLTGEPVQVSDIALFRKYTLPTSILIQFYGTTETRSITLNNFLHQGAIPEKISAGKPIAGVSVYILDDSLTILPFGQTGQIAVSSPLMATEYFNNPEATKKSFVIHPQTGQLTYLTGDLGQLSEDGFLYHLGRNDFMVKVRGSRVDILEIEDCLLSHPAVSDGVVVNKGDSFSETLLVAYYVLKGTATLSDLRQYVISKLPGYMIPMFFIEKEKLPLTTTGKTDRKNLTDEPLDYSVLLRSGENSQIEYDPLYQKLKAIWMEELMLPRLSPNHCFFNDLGGDSILAVAVLERIRIDMGINLPYFILFRYRTLDKLTEYIHRGGVNVVRIETLRKPKDDNSPVFIFVPPVKGGADSYNFALETFPQNYGLHILTYNVVNDENTDFYSLQTLVEHAHDSIQQLGYSNVYFYGYSIGGLLAFEIATGLNSVKVEKIILIDIPPAKKGKKNMLAFIFNDIRLAVRNSLKLNRLALRANFNHIRMCFYYLFSNSTRIIEFETKNHASMAEAAHLRLYRQFNPQQFNGDLLLIRSTDSQFDNYKFNWEKYATGNVTVMTVKSNHQNLLNKEVISEITKLIVESIEK